MFKFSHVGFILNFFKVTLHNLTAKPKPEKSSKTPKEIHGEITLLKLMITQSLKKYGR